MIKTHDGSQQALAGFGHTPAARPGDLGNQAAHVETLEQAPDGGAVAAPQQGVGCLAVQQTANVRVAKAVQEVFAAEYGLKEAHVATAGRVESGIGAPGG